MSQQYSFGHWLKRRRKALDLTQAELADKVGCSAAAIRKIEAEERRPSPQIIQRLSQIFGIPQSEQEAFLSFARGKITAAPNEPTELLPWRPPTASLRANLPTAVTSLIGREADLAQVHGYLLNKNIRLVTLIGPPGIGKTRLGLEAARKSLDDFRDGIFFIELAPLDDPSLIVPTIIETLGYVEAKNQPPAKRLTESIRDKQMLLVLDNCEHLIEEIAPLASGLLSTCSRLKILATSRESLRIPGEWLYTVPALDVPRDTPLIDAVSASKFAALMLFEERARASRSDFVLGADNIQAVASICVQLDGLPLAIELIATRIRLMSPQALLERLTDSFILSADGMRAVSARQKTLNNAIGWSYNFLSPEEQKMFACLSVFSGGFTLETAEAMFSELFASKPISDLVTSLSDKSLLQRTLDAQGEVRFNMLVTIQQFAADALRRAGDEAQMRDLHLSYFLAYAGKGEAEIRGPRQIEWAHRIQNEHNNMRAALDWAVSSQKTGSALRLLCALGWPWEIRGHYNEARNWLNRIRALPDVNDYPISLSRTLNHIGRYNWTQDNFEEARSLLEESRAISTKLGAEGEKSLGEALNWLGLLEIGQNKEAARPILERGLELNKRSKDDWGIALSTFHLGILESNSDHLDLALSLLEESLAMFRDFGDLFFISRVSIFLGYLFLDQGQYDRARQLFEQHISIDTELQFWDGIAEGWRDLGNLARRQGDHDQAEMYYERGRSVVREHGLIKTIP